MSKFSCYPVGRALDSAGIQQFNINEIMQLAADMSLAAVKACESQSQSGTTSSAPFPSCLVRSAAQAPLNSKVLVIDFGGTKTQVAMRVTDANGEATWTEIFNDKNSNWQPDYDSKQPLIDFSQFLGEKIIEKLGSDNLKFDGVSVIWSNAAVAEKFNQGISGVGARVTGREATYVKGETFVKGLKDGDSLHELIILGLGSVINFDKLIVGNDAVFTQFASSESSAGVVCSTGANATLNIKDQVYNSEAGHSLIIPGEFLSKAERKYYPSGANINKLAAGGREAIPHLFNLNLAEILDGLAGHAATYKNLKTLLNDPNLYFSGEDITNLANAESFPADLSVGDDLTRDEKTLLMSLASALHIRGGTALAALVYFSVANQVAETDQESGKSKQFTVAVDSSVARNSPVFLQALFDGVAALRDNNPAVDINIHLVNPLSIHDGESRFNISVPCQGAAAALNRYLV